MTKTKNHTNLWKQRLSLLLVFVFCLLVSASEYFPLESKQFDGTEQTDKSAQDSSSGNETYLNVAVDAVVPFAAGLASQVFHLIYEYVSFEPPVRSGHSVSAPLNYPFWEILLERIISPNAP
ncbi:hypothetical protein C943_02353 [Mariniradius saccharolyticus AK6]|uniref:Uncharacterized protein n=1 Tax=Mariniradius saccharolyticus AK6 TaxID=1239962 RepID=M7Y1W6_9BACT|nr:hypothetical protein [Mariniradius saccharolyticus]EMS31206.1 hypothetical protein C943_02353 [Mariniradius saccharolyticus AK6]